MNNVNTVMEEGKDTFAKYITKKIPKNKSIIV